MKSSKKNNSEDSNFNVILSDHFKKTFKKLNLKIKDKEKIFHKINLLKNQKHEQLDIKQLGGSKEKRIRSGNYRIFFLKEGDTIKILVIRHRQNSYKL